MGDGSSEMFDRKLSLVIPCAQADFSDRVRERVSKDYVRGKVDDSTFKLTRSSFNPFEGSILTGMVQSASDDDTLVEGQVENLIVWRMALAIGSIHLIVSILFAILGTWPWQTIIMSTVFLSLICIARVLILKRESQFWINWIKGLDKSHGRAG